jgi:hypothetical protein
MHTSYLRIAKKTRAAFRHIRFIIVSNRFTNNHDNISQDVRVTSSLLSMSLALYVSQRTSTAKRTPSRFFSDKERTFNCTQCSCAGIGYSYKKCLPGIDETNSNHKQLRIYHYDELTYVRDFIMLTTCNKRCHQNSDDDTQHSRAQLRLAKTNQRRQHFDQFDAVSLNCVDGRRF